MKASKLSKFKLCYEYHEDLPEINAMVQRYKSKLRKKLNKKK